MAYTFKPVDHRLKIVNARVVKVGPDRVEVELNNGLRGFCYTSEISDFSIHPLSSLFKENFFYKFLVKKFDEKQQVYYLNYKEIHPEEIRWKSVPIPTARHYYRLKSFLKDQITTYGFRKKGK